MIQFIRFLPILLPALASLVQADAATPLLPPCNISDIQGMNVNGCECQKHHDGCSATGCYTCGLLINDRHTNYKNCDVGCTNDDKYCMGCGVWFSTLCDCLKGSSSKCNHTGEVKPNGPMIWVLLPKDEPLVTTTNLLPGILEMTEDYQKYGGGWDFAQERYDPGTQALALNSVRSRTMEQLHIHLCPKPTKQEPKVFDILSKATLNPTHRFVKVQDDLYCISVENGKGPLKNFAEDIHNFMKEKKICEGLLGAGIMRDYHNNTWGCITGNWDGPVASFCAGH
ncbi:hypothetical protein V8C37DRAFT_388014 [Trichoderma ceciliae]